MKIHTICLELEADLYAFVDMQASDRAHHKGYSIPEMIENKPQKEQILKWLREIQSGKMRYK